MYIYLAIYTCMYIYVYTYVAIYIHKNKWIATSAASFVCLVFCNTRDQISGSPMLRIICFLKFQDRPPLRNTQGVVPEVIHSV